MTFDLLPLPYKVFKAFHDRGICTHEIQRCNREMLDLSKKLKFTHQLSMKSIDDIKSCTSDV